MPPEMGPPPAFGNPSLSNLPLSAPMPGQMPPGAGGPETGGALPRLVFEIEQQLQTLARALPPGSSEKLDAIREQLRECIAEAVSGGPAQEGMPPGGPY